MRPAVFYEMQTMLLGITIAGIGDITGSLEATFGSTSF